MQNDEPEQLCPFCGHSWGTCDHYRILSEWEAAAEATERVARRRKRFAAEDTTVQPLDERRPS